MSTETTSWKSARAAGRTFYFTGRPCKRGHVAERYSHNGECVIRARLRAAQWKKTAKGQTYQAEYRRTPKMWAHHRKYQNEWQNKRRAQRAAKSHENSG
jgi:YHS domain-containing protein